MLGGISSSGVCWGRAIVVPFQVDRVLSLEDLPLVSGDLKAKDGPATALAAKGAFGRPEPGFVENRVPAPCSFM